MNTYSIGMFAKRVGRSVNTLQRWDRTGKLVANRHPSGHRYYTDAHFDMDAIGRKEVGHLCLAHKDQLVRFGFDWFSHYCEMHGCELHILNHENLSPQQEMIQDMATIVDCFSSRLYGLRKEKKVLAADDSFTQNTPQSDT